MNKIQSVVARLCSWFIVLGLLISPWLAMVASILTTIKWYTASTSIVKGIVGFVVGGALSLVGMGVLLTLLGAVVYLCAPKYTKQDLKVKVKDLKEKMNA